MVQPQVINGLLTSCKLHDLMRELCLKKGKEEEFLEVKSMVICDENLHTVCLNDLDLCRQGIFVEKKTHYTVDCKIGIEKATTDAYMRALVIYPNSCINLEGCIQFKRLRSLIMDGCRFKNKKLPKGIREMIHLRYLSLQDSLTLAKLPSYIGDLQNLQTLNLKHNDYPELPNIFHKMKRLRYLYLPFNRERSTSTKVLEFHGLDELEVLEGFNSKCDQHDALSELLNIRRFEATISGFENLSTILDQLNSLTRVDSISISFSVEAPQSQFYESFPAVRKLLLCRQIRDVFLCCKIVNLPRYEPEFWPNLVHLLLFRTRFEEDPMPFLQELPNLMTLFMEEDAFTGKEMYCNSKAFQKLRSLSLQDLPSIEIWRVDAGAFPNLSRLEIRHCNTFKIVPDGLAHMTNLTKIDILQMPEEFTNGYGKTDNTSQ